MCDKVIFGKYFSIKTSLSFLGLFGLFLALVIMSPVTLSAQVHDSVSLNIIKKDSVIPFKDRIAFRTNTIDWLLMLPNIGFEFDLSGSPYGRMALAVNVKGNWSTYHVVKPYWEYDFNSARIEFKKYGRTSARFEKEGVKRSLGDRFSDFFRMRVKNPNFWRAYYWGVYVDLGGYNLKFSDVGRKGKYIGAGLALGYGIPLYSYRTGVLDLELGASIGAVYTKYNTYVYDENQNTVYRENAPIRKILPYPVISDLRVALVYRFSSIRNKYKMTAH